MKILVTWAQGMLARDIIPKLQAMWDVISCDHSMLDITDLSQVRDIFSRESPDIILNLAAYTDVEMAETQWSEQCSLVNTVGAWYIAQIAYEYDIDLITFSTNYVFDGMSQSWYTEYIPPQPCNIYGKSKYLGEQRTRLAHPRAIILRTSWLYGGEVSDRHFVNKILESLQSQQEISVVNDQYGSPTYTKNLANTLVQILTRREDFYWQILHLTDITPWCGITPREFAQEIVNITWSNAKVVPCTTDQFPSAVVRPKYGKLIPTMGFPLQGWKESLREYLEGRI